MTTRSNGGRWFRPVAEPPAPTAQLEPHPLALIFPEVTGADFDELVADIKANGLAEEIVTHEGKILDGRTRYAACKAAGVEPRYRPFERIIDFEGGPLDYVVSKNLTRRHLTTGQRAAIAADLAERKGESRPRDEKGHLQATVGIPTLAKAAKTLNVSRDSAAVARKVKRAAPQLYKEVKTGKTSLNEAEKVVDRKKRQLTKEAEPETVGFPPATEASEGIARLHQQKKLKARRILDDLTAFGELLNDETREIFFREAAAAWRDKAAIAAIRRVLDAILDGLDHQEDADQTLGIKPFRPLH
jgi:hypothetical protein